MELLSTSADGHSLNILLNGYMQPSFFGGAAQLTDAEFPVTAHREDIPLCNGTGDVLSLPLVEHHKSRTDVFCADAPAGVEGCTEYSIKPRGCDSA